MASCFYFRCWLSKKIGPFCKKSSRSWPSEQYTLFRFPNRFRKVVVIVGLETEKSSANWLLTLVCERRRTETSPIAGAILTKIESLFRGELMCESLCLSGHESTALLLLAYRLAKHARANRRARWSRSMFSFRSVGFGFLRNQIAWLWTRHREKRYCNKFIKSLLLLDLEQHTKWTR